MHLLCPRLQRQDRTEPGSQEIIPGQPSLPGNRQDLWGLQGLRDRSRCSAEAWWRRFAGKYAVAVAFVGARKGPDRIAPHSGYNCSACLTGRTSCSLATTSGCSTPEGRLGTPRYQARELLVVIILHSWPYPRERASIPISASPAPATPTQSPIRTLGKVRSAILGPGPTSHSSASILHPVQHPRVRAISRPIPGQCT